MADYMPLLKAIEKALAKADADLEAFLEEQGYPNPSGLVEAIDSVQDVLEELLDDYLERIATALIDCTDKFELMDAWNEAKEDAELKRAASDAVAEALFSYALPFLDEYIKNDDEELDASELSLKAIAEVLTLADQMTEGKIDSLNDRIEAGLQNYKEPEDSEADKAEKAAVEKGVLDDLKSKLRGLGSKIKSFGQRAIEYVFGSSKLDRARDCRGTATQTVLMYESVVQQEAIMQNPVVERKIWRHNPSDHPRENHVAMDGVMADADGFFELTGRDGNVYRIEGPRASSLPPSESYNCHCTVETVTNAEILNSDVETKSTLQDEAVANANEVFKTSADKELYERAMEVAESWPFKFEHAKLTSKRLSDKIKETMTAEISELSEESQKVLQKYTGFTATKVNSAIRRGQINSDVETLMQQLDDALRDGAMPETAVLHRDTSLSFLNLGLPQKPTEDQLKRVVNQPITNPIYTSTSFKSLELQGRNTEIWLMVPKGYKGCRYLKSVALPKYKEQEEVLFARGLTYVIRSARIKDGKYIFEAEVIDQ